MLVNPISKWAVRVPLSKWAVIVDSISDDPTPKFGINKIKKTITMATLVSMMFDLNYFEYFY